jgi:hypothetical protein
MKQLKILLTGSSNYLLNKNMSLNGNRMLSIYLFPPAALGHGIYSAFDRNEYQIHK